MALVDKNGKPILKNIYVCIPVIDITPAEVAAIIGMLNIAIRPEAYEVMPQDLKRHFINGEELKKQYEKASAENKIPGADKKVVRP
jgi:hypothetical protein